jgi:ABC-type polysaccharide/polyol phosphate export permease
VNTLVGFLTKIISNRYMIKTMVLRDMKSRYAGAFLGMVWSFIQPLALIGTYYFVFSVVFKARLGAEYGNASFTIWLISGLLPWLFFSEVVSRGTSTVVSNASLITKTVFPSEILPLVTLISGLVNHLITIGILLILGLALGVVKLSFALFLIIPFMLLMGLFALGASWFLSSVNVYLRDVEQVIGIILNLWFYFTPIVYTISRVPERFRVILKLNPVLFIVEGYRAAFIGEINTISLYGSLYALVMCLVVFSIGGFVFRKLKSGFGDVL